MSINRPKWIPHPTAWMNAVALFFLAQGIWIGMALVIPTVIALMNRWPRVGWLAVLAVWLSPIAAAAALHDFVTGLINRGASRSAQPRGRLGGPSSWRAGFFAWVTIIFVTLTTAFIMLVLNPPPPAPPDSVATLVAALTADVHGTVRSGVWIVLAAYVCELDRFTRST